MTDYHFVTRWRVPDARLEEVAEILDQPLQLVRWWPSVYLAARQLAPNDPVSGVGGVVALYTKGWLPYTLRWRFQVTERRLPQVLALSAQGDFVGSGRWTLRQDGDTAEVTYDWRIRATKPLLQRLTWLLRPVFAWNHHWAMARGYESLLLELRRRRGEPAPAPPAPTFARWIPARPW
jgi:hypothetical protein